VIGGLKMVGSSYPFILNIPLYIKRLI